MTEMIDKRAVCRMLGVDPRKLLRLRKRDEAPFPGPVAGVGQSHSPYLWDKAAVKDWMRHEKIREVESAPPVKLAVQDTDKRRALGKLPVGDPHPGLAPDAYARGNYTGAN